MELIKGDKISELVGDFGGVAHLLSAQLEGRKSWPTPKRLRFETTAHNFRCIRLIFPEIADGVDASPSPVPRAGDVVPQFRMEPRDYQLESFLKLRALHAVALFSEPGTGKTKTAIDIICWRFLRSELTGVLVLSNPKGVHAQWVTEQLPLHMWANVPYIAAYWNGRKRPDWMGWTSPGKLQIFSGNIDMVNSDRSLGILMEFCERHRGKLAIVIDESASIKSWNAKRSRRVRQLARDYDCKQRLIMTGTPIAKDLTDEWSQFYFLDPNIIGSKYKSTFQAQFCKMGGFENRHVVGYQNLDLFKALTYPYIFRARKDELNLPEKIYDTLEFDLTVEQKRMIREIRDTMMTQIDENSPRISAAHAAAAVLRMSQIASGFWVDQEKGVGVALAVNPRLEALKELLSHLSGKVIIWCRFQFDVEAVTNNLPGQGVSIFGNTPEKDRIANKTVFIENPKVRYLVATPDTAGQGLDGLQAVCENAIYYSNGYKATARWQSEDRIHRLGMRGAASYYDLVARGSPDRAILRNLRSKKTLSTLVLDDMKELVKEIDNE